MSVSKARRDKSATVHVGKKEKFPVDNAETAKSALHLLNNAKPPLSKSQRSHVISEAHKFVPDVKAPPPKGSKKPSFAKKTK